MPNNQAPIEGEEKPICSKCGNLLEEIDGELVCPKCDLEIDFFGEEDKEKEI